MEKRKSITIFLMCLSLTGINFAVEPNDCIEVHTYGYGYKSDYNKDCRVDVTDLNEITFHWVEDYTPEIPNLPLPPYPNKPPCIKSLYIDGVHVNDVSAGHWLTSSFDHIIIGSAGESQFLYNEYMGKMDEFAIYEGVLDSNRIQAHYNAKDSNDTYYAAIDQDNPLLWLRFEDSDTNNGDIAANSGSLDINGLYIHTGGTAPTKVPGINTGSNAVNFPDTGFEGEGTCIDVNDSKQYLGAWLEGDLSIELWVNFVDLNNPSEPDNSWPRFFQRKGSYGLYTNNEPNTLGIFGCDSTDFIDLPYDINDGNWHHIVVTYDSTFPPVPCCYDYEDYVQMDNPVLWLRFEDDTPQDSSGNDYWVSYGPAASVGFEKGGMGNSLYLDGTYGTDVYGCAASTIQLDANHIPLYGNFFAFAPNDITFEMWYKCPPEQDNFATFFQQSGGWENEPRAPGVTNSNGTIRVFCGAHAWESGVNSHFDTAWHHMVVTYDEEYGGTPNTMYVQLYLDGFEKGHMTVMGPGAYLGPELSHLLIGAQNNMSDTYNALTGYVDEFAIYEGVLDPNHILAHYLSWQPKSCHELWDRQSMPLWAAMVDMDENCNIDLYDFAEFALQWALCNDPEGGVGCVPNW